MTRYAGLLRGVNVGGVAMKMADLAEVVRGLGYDEVDTVLASGNVRFTTAGSAASAKSRLEAALRERFGSDAWVHVLPLEELRRIVEAYPFPRSPDRHAYVVFAGDPGLLAELLEVETDDAVEQVAPGDGVVYWTVPKGLTLKSAFGARQSKGRTAPALTTRNLNTLEKLLR